MPKPKGSPKTGGRKQIPEGNKSVYYERCTPEKRNYLKAKSLEFDYKKENEMKKTEIEKIVEMWERETSKLEKQINNTNPDAVPAVAYQDALKELDFSKKMLKTKQEEAERLLKIRYVSVDEGNCVYIGDYDVSLCDYEHNTIKKLGTLDDFADCSGEYIDALKEANEVFKSNDWKLIETDDILNILKK